MKNGLLICLLLVGASTASAEKMYCNFNEPSVATTYDSDTNKLLIKVIGEPDQNLVGHVIFGGNGVIKISDTGNNYFLEINTTQEGSDGMSDYVYPFHAILYGKTPNPSGGCQTDHLKKYIP